MANELQVIVEKSGLETMEAKSILEKFQDCYEVSSEWANKAKAIKVTGPDQKDDMAKAREGRLFLRDRRIEVEKARKELKENALRKGKAIDGIANFLKALIEPTEEYLDQQEHFVHHLQVRDLWGDKHLKQ